MGLLYEFKEAPNSEKAESKKHLDAYLDELRKGSSFSRPEILACLLEYYPDYRNHRRRIERR